MGKLKAGVGLLTETLITREMIDWADKIFVMEHEHKVLLREKFPDVGDVVVLNIPNPFLRYDVELEELLRERLGESLINRAYSSRGQFTKFFFNFNSNKSSIKSFCDNSCCA